MTKPHTLTELATAIDATDPQDEWGPWQLDPCTGVLTAHGYEVDLYQCTTSAQVLDWIYQIAGKAWADDATLAGLVRALDTLLHPQANLCPFSLDTKLSKDSITTLISRIGSQSP